MGKYAPGLRQKYLQRTTSVHMNEPRMRLERHAEDMAVDATITNLPT